MAKPNVESNATNLVKLCREFLLAADKQLGGKLFENRPHLDPRGRQEESAIQRCKDLLRDGFFQATFPSQLQQDMIGRDALINSGVGYKSIKKTLTSEGLDPLVQILGHAAHRYK